VDDVDGRIDADATLRIGRDAKDTRLEGRVVLRDGFNCTFAKSDTSAEF